MDNKFIKLFEPSELREPPESQKDIENNREVENRFSMISSSCICKIMISIIPFSLFVMTILSFAIPPHGMGTNMDIILGLLLPTHLIAGLIFVSNCSKKIDMENSNKLACFAFTLMIYIILFWIVGILMLM